MHWRPIALALTLLVCAAPAAHASSLADELMPDSTGVRLERMGKRDLAMRFPAKRLRALAGERARLHCGVVGERVGQFVVEREGGGGDRRLAAGDRSVVIPGSARFDFCALATRPDDTTNCLPLTAEERWCARALVARTAAGRGYVDQLARTIELSLLMSFAVDSFMTDPADRQAAFVRDFGTTLVGMSDPDSALPTGTVGYWAGETSDVFAATLTSGHRIFLRRDGDVFSTNSRRMLLPAQVHKVSVF
ncbi:hypothetical protein C8N24_6337 [Solirubrobacter pauli]|uniref:Uncharacterized protein n=1 Tax=Solirubrobacter pauli TaxID=166793 RepID=A0A660L4Q3_9ACTN|nr:hypothetical protein [Solirubrobacter pauli]RKQ88295.1 hypothetical protein C8N24_6337 [Solirubrobacter pauli]